MKLVIALLLLQLATDASGQTDRWTTYFEASGGTKTPRYDSTVAWCRRLAASSPNAHFTSFGQSAQGRALPLLIVTNEQSFTPASARAAGKAIVLVQAGIHAGEIDGKDAGLLLIRDLVIRHQMPGLLDSVVLLFVPIFNVDGHERFGPFNRINQNGPGEMGWRTTAQNLNLNRDYMKADSPEMRAFLKLFDAWLPDLFIDCHVTDGIDCQYDVTYTMELERNIDPDVARWSREKFLASVLPAVERSGHNVFWYVMPREETDLSKGFQGGGASTPRFSTGYAALRNRPALLIETHMVKPYAVRVSATYDFLKASLLAVRGSLPELKRVVGAADRRLETGDAVQKIVPLRFGKGPGFHTVRFLGVRHHIEPSALSGGTRIVYTGEPVEEDVPFYDETTVVDSVRMPAAYIVPPEWTFVPELLRVHGIHFSQLTTADTLDVDSYRFANIRFSASSYEGRQTATYAVTPVHERRVYPRGSCLIPTNQQTANVLVHLLEPGSPDSFVAWGFLNAIFEQKEYAEEYIMEEIGAEMLQNDAALKSSYEERVRTDSVFAADPSARLNWLYQRSPWGDRLKGVYPVGRVDVGK
jgi:hypothetical protein